MRKPIKLLCCGYRPWALDAFYEYELDSIVDMTIAENPKEMSEQLKNNSFDIVFLAGWSWIISDEELKDNFVVGVHPSDLPDFAGGTPLQHQILSGVTTTKNTLFKIEANREVDRGPIIAKADLSLEGDMEDIFHSLYISTAELLGNIILLWPNVVSTEQGESLTPTLPRLKPSDGEIKVSGKTAKQLYDFIRCRTDPYPNACVKDETGTLYFKSVTFEPS